MMNIREFILRNSVRLDKTKVKKNTVNLEYWQDAENVGDTLAPVIYHWMLKQKNITDKEIRKTIHLYTIGSILALTKYPSDAIVWGSGIHRFFGVAVSARFNKIRKLDIRAVRGPVTAYILESCGYKCPKVYGDPGILMPLIYKSKAKKVKGRISVIRHYKSIDNALPEGCHMISTKTSDYKFFIDEICSSELVISSSLHGIILAESYGIPAIFLQEDMDKELIKYYDWYYSTERKNIKFAYSIQEAMELEPMSLPENLDEMRKNLINTFPVDLWN